MRTKLKNIETGKVVDHTFNAGHKIDPVRIETREHQFLYNDDEGYHFMNTRPMSRSVWTNMSSVHLNF